MLPTLSLGLFLVLPFHSQYLQSNSCLESSFYGNHRDGQILRAVFKFSSERRSCFDSFDSATAGSYKIETSYEPQRLVWLEAEEIDDSLKEHNLFDIESWLSSLHSRSTEAWYINDQHQQSLQEIQGDKNLIWASDTAALISLSPELARIVDLYLPQFWKSTLLPFAPIKHIPVPPSTVHYVQQIVSNFAFDPVVASIVNNISLAQMHSDIRFLTGEDGVSGITSRHSFASGALIAAHWLKDRFEETGAKCHLKPFLAGFSPNVICRYEAATDSDSIVILGAHYDSRGTLGFLRAPGGDDDGSGTTSLLSIARTIARKGVKFHSNVELCAFAGEEQGLLGSKAYARQLREENVNVTLMIQADMLAYRAYQEPRQLGLPDLIGSPVAMDLVTKAAAIYSPELQVGLTPACCSDHQSFHEQGYVATQVFERAGPIADPMYHNSGDLSDREGYDFDQLRSIAKVQFAALLHTAGYELRK
ncbi:hypothetical protein AMATHDRAFT_142927 [Amanita thiersii Skay4041]|uniref:Peptide hydrolase n=1 Tax=Amanita thiersii Skay4041 TaxID=703135 RepID=A0A2A9NUH5_9AGAR|nr:hypothetical protein AMATHDRAFT_142927 [Amanita thiersii Skay4041]